MNIVNLSGNFYIQFSQHKITMFLQVEKCPNFLKGHFRFPIKQTYFTLHSGLGNINVRFQYKKPGQSLAGNGLNIPSCLIRSQLGHIIPIVMRL